MVYDNLRQKFPGNVISILADFSYPSKDGYYELSEMRIKSEPVKFCQDHYRELYQSELPPGFSCARALYDGKFSVGFSIDVVLSSF